MKARPCRTNGKIACADAKPRHAEGIYWHEGVERVESEMPVVTEDLFAESTWALFGLTRRQLAVTGAVSGAAVGSGVDLAVGGTSFLLGAGIGPRSARQAACSAAAQLAASGFSDARSAARPQASAQFAMPRFPGSSSAGPGPIIR